MPYMKETCVAGKTYEVRKYFTYQSHGKGTSREKKSEITPERIKKANQRNAEVRLRRLMNNNFHDGDYLIRLDCSKEDAVDSKQMQKLMQNFNRRLKRKYEKAGLEYKYIYVKEIGKRGSRHIHMMLNKGDLDWIRESWPHGGIHVDPLYSNGQYERIAAYFIKYALKTEETEGALIGKRWYSSRNLVPPKVVKKEIKSNSFSKKIKIKKGYYLDPDSVREGISEITGYEYFCYTLIKLKDKGGG